MGQLLHRIRLYIAALAVMGGVLYYVFQASAAVIPLPDLLVTVTTKSGNVTKTHLVPIGGLPIPIDVDGPPLLGVLEPDIDVSVGLVALSELPGAILVPNIVIRRNALALALNRTNPPLDIEAKVVLRDLGNGLAPIADVTYGFETPPGGDIPPVIVAKLVGPLQGGFVDPLQAKIESPGFSGPLKLKIKALTPALDARFTLDYDALPESIFVSEDPRPNGLDAEYRHTAPVADVHLDAQASIRNRATNELIEVGANIERLPQQINLSNTTTADSTQVSYDSSSALNKPDVAARYTSTDGQGRVVADADIKLAGLPPSMRAQLDNTGQGNDRSLDKVDFHVLNGGQIDALDFEVRNFSLNAPVGNVPDPRFGPDQFVAIGSRRQTDGSTRFRAAGRITQIRSVVFERQGSDNATLDARTDLGNGIEPMRGILDADSRGQGAPTDASWTKVDATLSPLPQTIHVNLNPTNGVRGLYEASTRLDATASFIKATGSANGCGQALVTCASATLDRVPTRLSFKLPPTGDPDYEISHNAVGLVPRPDIRATLDTTPADTAKRLWAKLGLLSLPPEVRVRLDSTDKDVLVKAEAHGCDYSYANRVCNDAQQAFGRVTFTLRDQPDRTGLPPRPYGAPTFVSLIRRSNRFEIAGRVDEIRNVVFHQRDSDNDGQADGTLGALIDAGVGGPFDAHIDQQAPDQRFPDPKPDARSSIDAHADSLPTLFKVCVRQASDDAPGASPDGDPLLAECERRDILSRNSQHPLTSTPMSIVYDASAPTRVTADLENTQADRSDGDRIHSDEMHTVVSQLPGQLRADVITPREALGQTPARKLEASYIANATIQAVDLTMRNRRADDSPWSGSSFLNAKLRGIPSAIGAVVDTSNHVLKQVEVLACNVDFLDMECDGPQQQLNSVDFLLRSQRSRGALPARPDNLAANNVSLIKRFGNQEISGHVDNIRRVAFRQRDTDNNGKADGTLGVNVKVGSGGPFDAHLDQLDDDLRFTGDPQPTAHNRLDVHFDHLSTDVKACFRQADDAAPSSVPADSLLAACDRTDVLSRDNSHPLTSTPLSMSLHATQPTRVTADLVATQPDVTDGDRIHTDEVHAVVDELPAELRADVITPREAVGQTPARKLEASYVADDQIGQIDFRMRNRRANNTSWPGSIYLDTKLRNIPSAVGAVVDTSNRVLKEVAFRACEFNFIDAQCDGPQQQLGSVDFLMRPMRERGTLPPRPHDLAQSHVSLIKRFDEQEITGHVEAIKNVIFRQRDANNDAVADGTLGVQVDAGTGDAFDAHLDTMDEDLRFIGFPRPTVLNQLDAHVDHMSQHIAACFRQAKDAAPGAAPPADPLLAPCDRTDVLSRDNSHR